jgi:hypothetical protein
MATYTPGQTLTAAIMQTLDDRVTVLEATDAGTAHGTSTTTTDANGRVTITHGLGAAPTTVLVTVGDGSITLYQAKVFSKGATTFVIQARKTSDGTVPGGGQQFPFDWQATV